MALRLDDLVEAGEIFNTQWYSTHGWLKLRGREEVLVLELTGNCCRDLQGWHIRFQSRPVPTDRPQLVERTSDEEAERIYRSLQWRQIGATGDISADRKVKWCECSVEEMLMREKAGEPPPYVWKPLLYLEWTGQNGRVVVELVDADVEFVKQEIFGVGVAPAWKRELKEKETPPAPGVTEIRLDEDGRPEVTEQSFPTDEEGGEQDPYGLFADKPGAQRKADDDDPFMRELEFFDDLIDQGDPGMPLTDYALRGMELPDADSLSDEAAEAKLKAAIGMLAIYNVAYEVCEHCTPREAYRLLVTKALPEARGQPDMRGTGWVQHYSTSDYCPKCTEEYET